MKKIPHVKVYPRNTLNLLSKREIHGLTTTRQDVARVFRDCALAILNTDSEEDDASRILEAFSDFDIKILPQPRGLMLDIHNAPAQAFVDGEIIRGIQEHLFAALRDIVYVDYKVLSGQPCDTRVSDDVTSDVFRILRNARVVKPGMTPNLVVCWGGHAIPRSEYEFSKEVGFQMGLRALDIVTGCGIGAMKGPMKGAAIGHAKQQIRNGRYIGISEPGIIASESPNAIVNELVIMPDIEKRLEAFVRLAHGIVVFPGGVGTLEEIIYLMAILMHPENSQKIPVVFVGSEECRDYFDRVDRFLVTCLGQEVRDFYSIVIGSPEGAAKAMKQAVDACYEQRTASHEAYHYNWSLHIDERLQRPFVPTHDNMAALQLDPAMPRHELAEQLRSAFSGIVAGNVKAYGIRQVNQHGPYRICGDRRIMAAVDELLTVFVHQGRMKLGKGRTDYVPCYRLN
jgi:pyrimidine/purine-5'-nucleotide nucleosidase